MDWTWLLAPGGLAGVLVTWLLRRRWDRVKDRLTTSWVGRRMNAEGRVISYQETISSLRAQLEVKNQEINSNRESFLRQLADKDAELATRNSVMGYQALALETLIRQGTRLANQAQEFSASNTSETSPTKPSSSPAGSPMSPTTSQEPKVLRSR
jgi:hypothetical protein